MPSADAYEELFEGHFWGLVRLARLLGADDPEDLAQEAFVRLHRKLGDLRDPNAALAYLRSTVCNLSRNRLRHLRMARSRHRYLAERGESAIAESSSADQAVIHDESIRELLQALRELPRRQRETVVLRYWLDLSERETAETLGIATGTVKAHTSRAMAALTEKMEKRK